MTILKILLLIVFMCFSSKALGLYVFDKIKKDREEKTAIGFLANLTLFFICELPVMFFKLSSRYLNIFGLVYLTIIGIIMLKYIKNKKIIKITKKEIIALIVAFAFMLLYMICIHFGYMETYDSYFYSVFTNSAQNAEHISTIDPYTGQSNLQNYYKYMSYYYQASFLANIVGLQEGYLVLIWVMTFMNYFFISMTAITLVRIARNKNLNNILTAFFLTFVLSIFRAPFNALHLVTIVLSIYCFTYMFDLFKEEKTSLHLLLICIIAGISITSTMMFIMLFFICSFYIVVCILKRKDLLNSVLYVGTPVLIILFLYIYESLDNIYVIAIMLFVLTILYLLFQNKKIIDIIAKLGYPMMIIIPIILILLGTPLYDNILAKLLIKKDNIDSSMQIIPENAENPDEHLEDGEKLILNYTVDKEIHSSSMKYIYENKSNVLSTILILITHSSILYGGMIFLLVYGIKNLRKKPEFLLLVVYIIILYNPLVRKGLSALTLGLEGRIYLFFNTIFGILGIYYLLEFIETRVKNIKTQYNIKKVLQYGSYVYITLTAFSILVYILQFDIIDCKKYSILAKVPNTLVEATEYFNKYIQENNLSNEYVRVYYTANTFNMSMIDKNVNKKIKIINSKEYMGYLGDENKTFTSKLAISAYFDSEGKSYLYNESGKEVPIEEKEIEEYIKYYDIQYITCKASKEEKFKNYINNNFEVIYSNDDVQILKLK